MLNELGQIELSKQVVLKPYKARDLIPYTLMTDEEITNGAGGCLFVDTESYINYFLIAFKDILTQKIIKFEINDLTGECFNERKLSWILHSYRTVGFNTNKFDLPVIWYAHNNQNCLAIKQIVNKIIFEEIKPYHLQQEYGYKIHKTNHIDLIEVCPLKGSLKLYAARLHAKRIQDLPFDIDKPLTDSQIDIVTDYCINGDLAATELLYKNLTEQIKLREELSLQYRQDLLSKSDAQIAEAVISSELKRLTGSWPTKPKIDQVFFKYQIPSFIFFQDTNIQQTINKIAEAKYDVLDTGRLNIPKEIENLQIRIGNGIYRLGSGGLHSSEKCMALKATEDCKIYDRDVASYYPAIALNCNLRPTHLGEDFSKVYKALVDRRLEAKKAKNLAISECLKITINGTFGKTGSPYSVLYAPEMMIQITLTGQLALLMLIERLELADIPVASANTDGILIYCPQSKHAEYLQIISMWEQITNFTTEETEYDAVYSRDVNAYIAIKKNKEVKGKNVYYDPWRGKSAKDNYWKFQKNPTTQICVEALERFIVDQVSVEKTIKECTDLTKFVAVKNVTGGAHKNGYYLGKVVRWYYSDKEHGTINYIKNNNKVPDTDRAKPVMDLPEEFPNDINYQFYIDKTIEMLYDIGYYKKQEQLKLW
jgi:DNA polymerase elongation subunit (family B)